ncbi:MAG: SAM-dependent methyltransferase [Anaerolineales bacterium]|nr:SAM-dependent methyltransferase [Anaerolineales bacterium]MCA9977633.1 SAM-dependent methyltransferase [Anaerolineales bacterium]
MSKESIIDDSKPNAGRMYDYYLGGNHNFEVDRQAAEQVIKLMPFAPKGARLQRWALQDIAVELTEKRGYDVIVDFASGLPTNDHIHQLVPEGTTVIYSDYDPVVVEYAYDILGDTPNVYFFEADAANPEALLSRPDVQKILGEKKKIGFVLWGVSAFLTDEAIARIARYTYEWAAPGSCLVFNAQGADLPQNETLDRTFQIYERLGAKFHKRSLTQFRDLLQPWSVDQDFVSLLEWHGFDESELDTEDLRMIGPLAGGYGAYLVK